MVLYIAKRGPHNIGAITHKQALKDIYGAENLFEINLMSTEVKETGNYISFGNNLSRFSERISRYLQGNIPSISNQIIKKICEIIDAKKVDLVFTEESDLGNLYKTIKRVFPNVKIICFFHDIVADLFSQRIKDTPKWKRHYILELKRAISQERVTTEVVDECWCFHKVDAERFRNHYNRTISTFIPLSNFVPPVEDMNDAVTGANDEKTILFVCSKYYVNIAGFRWFYSKVAPRLKGNYRIQLVGDGAKALTDLTVDKHINIVGEVDSMTDYYNAADIVIAPVFDGGGMKAKTIEALSFGKCFISTNESLNGYWECVPENIRGTLICNCNTPEEWIKSCNQMIGSRINRFNREIFDMFLEEFSYERMVKRFENSLKM